MQAHSLTKNTSLLTGALIIQKVLSFFYFWFIANHLFSDEIGKYVFALSFTTLSAIFIDLGLAPILTREAAKHPEQANRYLQNILGLKLPLALITICGVWLTINLSDRPIEVVHLVYLASIVMALDSFSLSFWISFRAFQNLTYESIMTIIIQLVIVTSGAIVLYQSHNILYLMIGLVVASIINTVVAGRLLQTKLGFSLRPRWDWDIIKHVIKLVPTFAAAGIIVKIYNTHDTVLLSYLAPDKFSAVGLFAVPAKIVYAFQQVIPAAAAAALFPALSAAHAHNQEQLPQLFHQAWTYLLAISLPLAAGLAMLAHPIIQTLWPRYLAVVPTLQIMALAIPCTFAAFPTGYLLNACDQQRWNTLHRGIVTGLAVILNILLIPELSFYGAGITFLITNLVLIILDLRRVHHVITLPKLKLLTNGLKIILSTLIMMIAIYALEYALPLHGLIRLLTVSLSGILIYGVTAWFFGIINFKFSRKIIPTTELPFNT